MQIVSGVGVMGTAMVKNLIKRLWNTHIFTYKIQMRGGHILWPYGTMIYHHALKCR